MIEKKELGGQVYLETGQPDWKDLNRHSEGGKSKMSRETNETEGH